MADRQHDQRGGQCHDRTGRALHGPRHRRRRAAAHGLFRRLVRAGRGADLRRVRFPFRKRHRRGGDARALGFHPARATLSCHATPRLALGHARRFADAHHDVGRRPGRLSVAVQRRWRRQLRRYRGGRRRRAHDHRRRGPGRRSLSPPRRQRRRLLVQLRGLGQRDRRRRRARGADRSGRLHDSGRREQDVLGPRQRHLAARLPVAGQPRWRRELRGHPRRGGRVPHHRVRRAG